MVVRYRKIVSVMDQEIRFRMPKNLVKVMDKNAVKNGRSRNAEILYRLVQTIEVDKEK